MENYEWTQTLSEVLVTLPTAATKKDVKVDVGSRLRVVIADKVLIDGELSCDIVQDEVFWLIIDGVLEITLAKRKKDWWSSVVKGHRKIDTTKIEPERSSLNDLDAETRMMVEKMMVDQREKM